MSDFLPKKLNSGETNLGTMDLEGAEIRFPGLALKVAYETCGTTLKYREMWRRSLETLTRILEYRMAFRLCSIMPIGGELVMPARIVGVKGGINGFGRPWVTVQCRP